MFFFNTKRRRAKSFIYSLPGLMMLAVVSCVRPVPPSSVIRMGDKTVANQLIAGFYDNIGLDWRWTTRQFAVVLQPPPGSETSGAKLRAKIYIPEPEMKTLGSITLNVDVGEYSLTPMTYKKPGVLEYDSDIPSSLISPHVVLPVVFHLDRALEPWQGPGRQLGLVVSEIALRSSASR